MEENQNPTQQPVPVVSPPTTPTSTSPTSNPPPIVKKSAKFSIKAIIGTIIFLLVAGGAAAGFVYREPILKLVSNPTPTPTVVISPTPTPDPTADWRTYEGEGFSFKYPSAILLSNENCATSTQDLVLVSYHESIKNNPQALCNERPVQFFQITKGEFSPPTSNEYSKITIVDTELSGLKVKKYISTSIPNQPTGIASPWVSTTNIPFEVNTTQYTLFYGFPNPEFFPKNNFPELPKNIFEQILSTFKFMDLQTTENSSWKLFENELLSFRYPEELIVTENNGQISLKEKPGGSGFVYLEIYTKPDKLTDYASIPTCDKSEPNKECIATEGWEQKNAIENITLGNKKAVSFYLSGFGDYARHVVQTLENPKIELNMNVAGGGLDGTFSKILTSLKFLKQ